MSHDISLIRIVSNTNSIRLELRVPITMVGPFVKREIFDNDPNNPTRIRVEFVGPDNEEIVIYEATREIEFKNIPDEFGGNDRNSYYMKLIDPDIWIARFNNIH